VAQISIASPDLGDTTAAGNLLRSLEAGTDLEIPLKQLRSDPHGQLALTEMYDLPTCDRQPGFSFSDTRLIWHGEYTFILEVVTLPSSLGSPTQSLLVKFLRPSQIHNSDAVAALHAEAVATAAAFDSRLVHSSRYALISVKAAGVNLEAWLQQRGWLTSATETNETALSRDRLDAMRDVGLALCRALHALCSRTPQGHDNLALSSILVVDDPTGLEVNLVDLAADVPAKRSRAGSEPNGYASSTVSDAYGVGIAMLQIATTYKLVIDGEGAAETIQRALAELWGDAPGFARIIEDLVDGKPSQRLLTLAAGGSSEQMWTDLEDLIRGEYELLTLFRPPTGDLGRTDAGIATWSQVRRYFDVARQIKLGVRANWPASNLLKWLNLLAYTFWVLELSGFLVLTSADLGLSTPGGSAAQLIRKYADFRLGNFWGNFPGRLIALSFAYTALMYYMRILSGVTVRRLGLPWIEICLRLTPIALNAPAMAVIYYDPGWWPIASALGVAAVVIINWTLTLLDRQALQAMRAPFDYPEAAIERAELARSRHRSWWKTSAIYLAIFIALDLCLYRTHILRDEAFYAILLAIGCNFYALYWNSIRKLDRLVRGCLEQSSFVLRRAELLRSSTSRPTIFRMSEVPGGTLAFAPASVVLALIVFGTARQGKASVVWVLGSVCCACALVGFILLPLIRRRTDLLSLRTANAVRATMAGGALWSLLSFAVLPIAAWWRLFCLLASSTVALASGDQIFRRASRGRPAHKPRRRSTSSRSPSEDADAFVEAESHLSAGGDPLAISFDLGLALIGDPDPTNPENVEASLIATWQTSPRVGRLAELLLLPTPTSRLVVTSCEHLDSLRRDLSGDRSSHGLVPTRRARVCLERPDLELRPGTLLVLKVAGIASLLIAIVCTIGWIYFAFTDLDLTRTAGRTLALSYSLCAAYYYRVFVGWVTVAGMRRTATEFALRTVPFVFQGPAITAIFFWPALWPLQATIGVGATALVNYLMLRIIRDADTALAMQPTWHGEVSARRKTPFESWWTTACVYLAGVLVFDILLTATGVLHDSWLYATGLAFGCNIYVIGFSSVGKNGPAARGQVVRATVLLRVLGPATSRRHIRAGAPTGLLIAQASLVSLAALWVVLALGTATSALQGATILFVGALILLIATLTAQYFDPDPVSPRVEASSRVGATLACWCMGLGTFVGGEFVGLPLLPAIVFCATLPAALMLGARHDAHVRSSSTKITGGTMKLHRTLRPADALPPPPPPPGDAPHPIVDLLLQRLASGYKRESRTDGAVIALAIEGGGLGGAVSAGMCLVLEQAGLIDAVDVIYGTSSGALNGSFTAAGQAALGSTNYLDTANRRFANPLRILWGRTAIDFDLLFDDLIRNRKPYDAEGLAAGPPFRALGVDLETSQPIVLRDFADVEELMLAVRVSCSLPLLSGPPVQYRGRPMADGGLLESMPYRTAFAEGATHVLVLRSRPATYRKEAYPKALVELVRRAGHPALAPLVRERPDHYNTEAEHLQKISTSDPTLLQVAPAANSPKVSQLERSDQVIREGMAAGANAAAQAFGLPAIDLFWQPSAYTTRVS
jgi:predicted acylesterase/phospholipase RssA